MSQSSQVEGNFFDYLIDSFWAAFPEETANKLANFEKDVLIGVRSAVDRLVDLEINCLDRHLENARHMRERYRQTSGEASPNPS
ncbi:MAG TPA: hypothetical protein VEF04_12100 [Blastocatellia bacterium]|nr:hypothetical protein [Blastocatellia bacterium]